MNANIVNIHIHAGVHRHLSRSGIEAMRAANWGFSVVAAAAAKGTRASLMRLLLLFFLVLFAQQAADRLVYRPCHVVLTPVLSVFAHFFLVLLTILQWLFLPGFILLLFPLVVCILLVLLLVPLVALFLSFSHNSAEFGVQLELAFERIKRSGHPNNLLNVWGFCPPEYLGFQPVKLVLCRCHKGLVGDVGKFTIKVILMLTANVHFEVVAEDNKVSFE
jgi:hypothetical protein